MFEKLEVYQKALNFAEQSSNITESFPRGHYYLVDQINRASLSIAANLAEGNGRWHNAERKQFFWIARGSAQECVPLIEIAKRKKFIKNEEHQKLLEELETINKMIVGLIKGLEKTSTRAEKANT